MILLEEVMSLKQEELLPYIKERAIRITLLSQGKEWDDPEAWQLGAVELAHAIVRLVELAKEAGATVKEQK